MDIEKICRTCLTLSGPLLSIYDSGGGGSGCLADMLREFTKTKPQPNDMMPEKVCLSCISEINHCYSFKLKCENSNKTLRQLIPNAFNEEPVDILVKVNDIGTQTERPKYVSTTMQTMEDKDVVANEEETYKFENRINIHKYEDTKWKNAKYGSSLSQSGVKRMRLDTDADDLVENINGAEESYIVVEAAETDVNAITNNRNEEVDATNAEAYSGTNTTSSDQQFEYFEQDHDSRSEAESKETIDYLYKSSVDGDGLDMDDETEFQIITNDEQNHLNKVDEDDEEEMEVLDQPELLTKHKISQNTNDGSALMKFLKCKTESRKKEYKCPRCFMTFVSLKYLRRHLSTRHDIEPASAHLVVQKEVKQVTAKRITRASIALTETMANPQRPELTEESVPIPRLQPRERISSPAVAADDLNTSNLKYFCEYCKAGFVWRKTLTLHMKQNICKSDNFKCNICGRIFITKMNLEAHEATHSNQHTCLECKKACATIEDLSQHMITAHNRNARNQCNVCKKVFTMKTSLMDHMRIHSGEKPFLCTVCGKSFRQNSNLRQHVMRHTNEKNFKCDLCPNAYVTKAELFSHKRTHTGDHPFKCELCNARFTSSSSLQKHRRKHTGERPYACEFCPMRFTALNILKNHRRTHTGEKPYQCELCDKRFSQKGDCQMHQRTHNEKHYACNACGTKYSKPANLRQHMRTHHSTIPKKDQDNADRTPTQNPDTETRVQITIMDEEQNEDEEQIIITHSEDSNSPPQEKVPSTPNDNKTHTEEDIMKMACLLI